MIAERPQPQKPRPPRLIQTRVAATIAEVIDKAAQREGISIADYVRRMLIQEARRLGAK